MILFLLALFISFSYKAQKKHNVSQFNARLIKNLENTTIVFSCLSFLCILITSFTFNVTNHSTTILLLLCEILILIFLFSLVFLKIKIDVKNILSIIVCILTFVSFIAKIFFIKSIWTGILNNICPKIIEEVATIKQNTPESPSSNEEKQETAYTPPPITSIMDTQSNLITSQQNKLKKLTKEKDSEKEKYNNKLKNLTKEKDIKFKRNKRLNTAYTDELERRLTIMKQENAALKLRYNEWHPEKLEQTVNQLSDEYDNSQETLALAIEKIHNLENRIIHLKKDNYIFKEEKNRLKATKSITEPDLLENRLDEIKQHFENDLKDIEEDANYLKTHYQTVDDLKRDIEYEHITITKTFKFKENQKQIPITWFIDKTIGDKGIYVQYIPNDLQEHIRIGSKLTHINGINVEKHETQFIQKLLKTEEIKSKQNHESIDLTFRHFV